MALSTSMPIAMMNPASEVRLMPSPVMYMSSMVPPMVNSSDDPISAPLRMPITAMMTAMTISTDSSRLSRNEKLASRAMMSSG